MQYKYLKHSYKLYAIPNIRSLFPVFTITSPTAPFRFENATQRLKLTLKDNTQNELKISLSRGNV